jgi:transcriptional regulator with XRE-family HTH domain
MGAMGEALRHDLLQPEFSEGYADSFQDAYVATQIKVLREQNKWTQADLALKIGTTQTAISRIENVNYSAWNISTLKKLARAFRVRLKVSFETYGSLIHDMEVFSGANLQRAPRDKDPELSEDARETDQREQRAKEIAVEENATKPCTRRKSRSIHRIRPGTVRARRGMWLPCHINRRHQVPCGPFSSSPSEVRPSNGRFILSGPSQGWGAGSGNNSTTRVPLLVAGGNESIGCPRGH